ncbi:MAG: hypothetical protein U1E60_01950 [Reyranellaceae bacterium]
MARVTIPDSTYLDLTSYGMTTATTVEAAYGLGPPEPSHTTLNVALILPRANDPTSLLNGDWASRQAALAQLEKNGTLWTTYGASQTAFDSTKAALESLDIPVLGDASGAGGYVTSAASRTIWIQLSPENFTKLFDRTLYGDGPYLQYWHGDLTLPDTINVAGIWFDAPPVWGTYPATSDMSGGTVANLEDGFLSIGNGLASTSPTFDFSGDVGQWFYNFPLAGKHDVKMATIGLLEPLIGDAVPSGQGYTFQRGLDSFRSNAGLGPGTYYNVAHNGQSYDNGNSGERSLDIGVVASAAPGSEIGLYAGSGDENHATGNAYTAYQAAFHDDVHKPAVVSSSYGIFQQTKPDSIFRTAVDELFVDAALHNITSFVANNDWGSSYDFPNGIANQNMTLSSPYAVLVGGTSLTTLAAASGDPTIYDPRDPSHSLLGKALAHDPATLWLLVEGGLATMPTKVSGAQGEETTFLEAVWNVYALRDNKTVLDPGLSLKYGGSSDGGVDTTRPTPGYQTDFGLAPTSVNPDGGTGRGAPDVSANAGGNMWFYGPPPNMAPGSQADLWEYWGTSASTPLWASLAAQIDAVFNDQGLPNLGYANDLLYIAAAIAPASFNDIVFGNNIASYLPTGPINGGTEYDAITLTGFGYNAGPSYDLTTGLGSPNGLILTRTLSAIAHAQTSFADSPPVLDGTGSGGWKMGATQSLLVQTISTIDTSVTVVDGSHQQHATSGATAPFAWTTMLAQQSLQADFDAALVRLFDGHQQGALMQVQAARDTPFAVTIGGAATTTPQVALTNDHGFVDFAAATGKSTVQVAREVAIAETAGHQDDQLAVVRLRQNGVDEVSVTLFRVDDLSGTIAGLQPGDPLYATAAQIRAYQTTEGGSTIFGAGYGNYTQAMLTHVNAGDLIAIKLTDHTTGHDYWSFAQANEVGSGGDHVGHAWNYGLNTWGFEDQLGGGDRDFNDVIVGLDFTSASGHGWPA